LNKYIFLSKNYQINFIFLKVELALKAKPNDPELLKLKEDLEEVIKLTADLLGYDASILNSDSSSNYPETSSNSSSLQSNNPTTTTSSNRTAIKWKTGDRCLAPWNEDGKYVQ